MKKWHDVELKVDHERLLLRACEENRESCQSQAAIQFLAIIDTARSLDGRARLGEINRAINLKLKPMSDLALYGADGVWSPPLATFAKGAGDCEDYAIAKFVALQEAGIASDALRIVILRDDRREEDHAVVAVRLDRKWIILDNRYFVMPEDRRVRAHYHPIFLFDHDGVRGYAGGPFSPDGSHEFELAVGQIRP